MHATEAAPAGDAEEETEECPICLDSLAADDAAAFIQLTRKERSCAHHCHLSCAQRLQPEKCPLCRQSFARLMPLRRAVFDATDAGRMYSALSRLFGAPPAGPLCSDVERVLVAVYPLSRERLHQRIARDLGGSPRAGQVSLDRAAFASALAIARAACQRREVEPPPASGGTFAVQDPAEREVALSLFVRARLRLRSYALRLIGALGGCIHGFCIGTVGGAVLAALAVEDDWEPYDFDELREELSGGNNSYIIAFSMVLRVLLLLLRAGRTKEAREMMGRAARWGALSGAAGGLVSGMSMVDPDQHGAVAVFRRSLLQTSRHAAELLAAWCGRGRVAALPSVGRAKVVELLDD
eukprot:TRINITY_DN55891_c0_g1_i1.p2 TRINITY_DN55891_c0_g1~~TRINITY_DN55891_c0_g1_i1.p2  ORF type:complete len:353 (+),score=72.26 TRINITY_DN55891_c0_g1_i1:72-1130(+)